MVGIAALAGIAVLVLAIGAWRRARGLFWRMAAVAMLLTVLVNPSLVEEKRAPLRDVAVIVLDELASQGIGERREASERALTALTERLGHERDLDVRVVRTGQEPARQRRDGTKLFTALSRSLADVPRQRLAGIVMITDGQVHDVPDRRRRKRPARWARRCTCCSRDIGTSMTAGLRSRTRRASGWSARKCR